jgi:hypothetical protein
MSRLGGAVAAAIAAVSLVTGAAHAARLDAPVSRDDAPLSFLTPTGSAYSTDLHERRRHMILPTLRSEVSFDSLGVMTLLNAQAPQVSDEDEERPIVAERLAWIDPHLAIGVMAPNNAALPLDVPQLGGPVVSNSSVLDALLVIPSPGAGALMFVAGIGATRRRR